MSVHATQQSGELRIAEDREADTWQQVLAHYGQANALWHWRAAPLSLRPAAHNGGAATEQGGYEDGAATEHAVPGDDDTTGWRMFLVLLAASAKFAALAERARVMIRAKKAERGKVVIRVVESWPDTAWWRQRPWSVTATAELRSAQWRS